MPDDHETEKTESGQPIYRYDKPKHEGWVPPQGGEFRERLEAHMGSYLKGEATVWHELVSQVVHIDVYVYKPTVNRPYFYLVTNGMSDLPMTIPPGGEEFRYGELVMALPANWFGNDPEALASGKILSDERVYWPIRLLKQFARFPHGSGTWLGWGHSIPHGDPPRPLAEGTDLSGLVLFSPILPPQGFARLEIDPQTSVHFYSLIPVYSEEMDLKLKKGAEGLAEALARLEVSELLDPKRPNAVKRKGFWPWGR